MQRSYEPLLGTLFVTLLVVSNIIAVKIVTVGGLFLPAAIIIFPFTYVIGDVVTEVYGYASVRRIIWTGFLCNVIAVLVLQAAIALPPAPFFSLQTSFGMIFGAAPRILIASLAGYLVGGFSNAFIMARMKVRMRGRLLPVRTIASTIVGEGLDSLLFITIAFWGIIPQPEFFLTIVGQWTIKTCIEVLVTPVTALVIAKLKKRDQSDVYDTQTNFNPVSL